ncbi:MAG: membrane protein insertase YidC [Amylibacter sp.]|nr:membrane protein insertase YidC [Amylibacter sp.]
MQEDDNTKNLILASVLSLIVILGWFWFFPPEAPLQDAPTEATQIAQSENGENTVPSAAGDATVPLVDLPSAAENRDEALAKSPRVKIDSARVFGSISLTGALIDDLSLKDYNVRLNDESEKIRILSPIQRSSGYWAFHAWWSPDRSVAPGDVPTAKTLWSVKSGDVLSETRPVVLQWDNGKGLVFERTITIDANYLISIKQSVQNNTGNVIQLAPYAALTSKGDPDIRGFYILHEGAVASIDGELVEETYKNVRKFDVNQNGISSKSYDVTEGGWIGFTNQYWMTNLMPEPDQSFETVLEYNEKANRYQADVRLPAVTIAPNGSYDVVTSLFAGAKEYGVIKAYQKENGYNQFIDSIDWGMFFFLTKPIFQVLHFLNGLIGNMGLAIIGLTLLIKALLFPLAYKSFVSMAKMKELQPQMEAIKEKAGDDKKQVQAEIMKLYRAKKVNPASGCLPILLQIPIFFSLYKVIFVTIELYHVPFFGWIQDLSSPDPTSILNLFGLLPWTPTDLPQFTSILSIGVLPILMGITMWLQQKLNPAPTDKTQAQIFAWMPWVFMFMLGRFASGLVVYWVANNTITFIQQYTIMTQQGVKPDILGNMFKRFKKDKADS